MRNVRLLWSLVKVNWQQETAYFFNMLIGAITPLLYVLTFIIFISVLYQNVDAIAGYSKDEMLFLLFMMEAVFYCFNFWSKSSLEMEHNVNTGKFDFILVRPVSSMFYATFFQIEPLRFIINILGPLTPIWLVVDWSQINLQLSNLPYAIIIFICGIALFHQAQFIMSLVSFWTGKGTQASLVVFAANSQAVPLEGMSLSLRLLFIAVIPVYAYGVLASVMLGKSNPVIWTVIVLSIFLTFSTLKRIAWSAALKNYSSASS